MTPEQFDVYRKHRGDFDLWARSQGDRVIMKGFDYAEFSELLSDLYLVSKNMTSEEFKNKTMERLNTIAEGQELQKLVINYAANLYGN